MPTTNQYVQVPPNSTGLKMQTFENTVGGNIVESEAVTLVRSSDNSEIGTSSQPIRVDPTGTTTQPTSGTDNITQFGGVAIQAAQTTSTDGTGANQVVRNLPNKFSQVVTTTVPTASSTTYYPGGVSSPTSTNWYDSSGTGITYLIVSGFQDNSSFTGANTLVVEAADDPNDTTVNNKTCSLVMGATQNSGANNTAWSIQGPLLKRYWRIRSTIGTTAPTSVFKISYTGYQGAPVPLLNGATGALVLDGSLVGDGFTNANVGCTGVSIDNSGSIRVAPLATQQIVSGSGVAGPFYYLRTPTTFKTVSVSSATSGNSAVWTPTSGRKFRLMRFQITGSNLAATAATVVTLSFQDSASGITIGTYDVLLPAIANVQSGVTNISNGWIDLGNGFLSAAANNVLNLNVSSAPSGATGTYRVNVAGTEE